MLSKGAKGLITERLRVGLVIDSTSIPAWMAQIVTSLKAAEFIELTGVIVDDRALGRDQNTVPFLFKLYERLDNRLFGSTPDPLEEVAVSGPLAGIPHSRLSELSSPEGLSAYVARWDVLIWLSRKESLTSVAAYARYGVWECRHSYSNTGGDSAEYFWELFDQNPISKVDLIATTETTAEPEVIASAVSSTELGWSLRKNRQVPYWRGASLLVSRLHSFFIQQADWSGKSEADVTEVRHGTYPSTANMITFLFRNAVRTVSRRMLYSHQERHWFIAYRTDKSKFISENERFEPDGFRDVSPPPGRLYADPFVVDRFGRSYILFEDYSYDEQKGSISAIEVHPDGSLGPVQVALERPYHLSYPFTFEYNGELFMIPETLANRSIELYRATDFPGNWELIRVLKNDIDAVDTTMWIEDGVFFFFTNISREGSTVNDDLFLFHSRELEGEWVPHPANPICTDVRRSRSAGSLFRRRGKLIRPGQDCSVRYGYACQLNEVEELSPKRYRERAIDRIEPTWHSNLIGTHTINAGRSVEVIDGQIYMPKKKVRD